MQQPFPENTESFIGRQREIQKFIGWFTNPDPAAPWILYVHDQFEEVEKKGGIGKTWLLRKWADLIRHEWSDQAAVVMVDFFNIVDRDRVSIAHRIVAGLQALYPGWEPTAFFSALAQDAYPDTPSTSSETTSDSEYHGHDTLDAALASDLQQLRQTYQQVAGEASSRKMLLVFFDTFELVENSPNIAVLRQAQTFPDSYGISNMRVVIAGRNALNWSHANWLAREREVLDFPLQPFDNAEMLQYIHKELYLNIGNQSEHDQQLKQLYMRTEGRPILLGLAVDVLNNRVLTLEELVEVPHQAFEAYLVSLINKLDQPLNWVVLLMAHIYHRFNLSLLHWVLQNTALKELAEGIDEEELLSILPQLTFVRQPSSSDSGDFVLHDEMRRLVTKYCWSLQDPHGDIRKEISKSAITYIEEEIKIAPNEQIAQAYTVDVLYHRMFVSHEEGFDYFALQFKTALRLGKYAFARMLLQEIQPFTLSLTPFQRCDIVFFDARLAIAEEYAVRALDILDNLLYQADPKWLLFMKDSVLMERGKGYYKIAKYHEAIDCFERSLAIIDVEKSVLRCAHLLNYIGLSYQSLKQLDKSLEYYEKSIILFKEKGSRHDYANVLNSVSNVYLAQGKIEEALNRCRFAVRIRESLFEAGQLSEITVASSYRTFGNIYADNNQILEAERYFERAKDIYLRNNLKSSVVDIYNRLGEIYMSYNNYAQAQIYFSRAQSTAAYYNIDAYIKSLSNQGCLYMQQDQWAEAANSFKRAIEVAGQTFNNYQLVESLNYLAISLSHLHQSVRALKLWEQAAEIAHRENYLYLLGLIESEQGKQFLMENDYMIAFDHFVRFCHYMALHNNKKFRSALDYVFTDYLFQIPKEECKSIFQNMNEYWIDKKLEIEFPDFMNVCARAEVIIFM